MNYPLLRYLFGMILLIVAAFLVLLVLLAIRRKRQREKWLELRRRKLDRMDRGYDREE